MRYTKYKSYGLYNSVSNVFHVPGTMFNLSIRHFQTMNIVFVSKALSHNDSTYVGCVIAIFIYLFNFFILPAISPRPLNESQPNFPCRWRMDWSKKCGSNF